ncbi:YhcN/YlaJ family sporulation lipoprotein [Ferdinandcohnia quinoae]|nr:YhcN/YlaJ family sporulation lipoprotein [Fredinandcohnia sp. SECRCQ15]
MSIVYKKIIYFFTICLLLTGCTSGENKAKIAQSNDVEEGINDRDVNQSIAEEAEKKVVNWDEVTGAVAVTIDHKLLLAFKVKQFDKFHLNKIEKKVKDKLKKEFPDYKPVVSSDLKIFLETTKLKKKIAKEHITKHQIKKDFKRIKKLSEEQT